MIRGEDKRDGHAGVEVPRLDFDAAVGRGAKGKQNHHRPGSLGNGCACGFEDIETRQWSRKHKHERSHRRDGLGEEIEIHSRTIDGIHPDPSVAASGRRIHA